MILVFERYYMDYDSSSKKRVVENAKWPCSMIRTYIYFTLGHLRRIYIYTRLPNSAYT